MAKLELEQEKKNLQFSKIDMAFAHSRLDSYRELADVELSLLPLLGRLLKRIFR